MASNQNEISEISQKRQQLVFNAVKKAEIVQNAVQQALSKYRVILIEYNETMNLHFNLKGK